MNENKKRREQLIVEIQLAKWMYEIEDWIKSPNFCYSDIKVRNLEESLAKLDRRKIKRQSNQKKR